MNIRAKHILVKGKVQGVFFRKYARQKAEELHITGWVKNTDDGQVEIFAQAREEAIAVFIEWCKEGSPKADVKEVMVENAEPDNGLTHFSVMH